MMRQLSPFILFITTLLAGCADIAYALKGYHMVTVHQAEQDKVVGPQIVNVVFDHNANQLPMCVNSQAIAEVSVPTYDVWGHLYDRETITDNFKKAAASVGGNYIVDITRGVNSGDGSLMLSGYVVKF